MAESISVCLYVFVIPEVYIVDVIPEVYIVDVIPEVYIVDVLDNETLYYGRVHIEDMECCIFD